MSQFIVIEALDAGGSQTQTDLLVKRLKKEKFEPLSLHFPQEDRATGQFIYQKFLFNKKKNSFSQREQALLYIQDFFSRLEDIEAITKQAKGRRIVVSDRFYSSTMAYQTIGLPKAERARQLAWLRALCYQGKPALPKPTLTILIDTPVAISLQRLKNKSKDFFETEIKLTDIRNSYLTLAHEEGWFIISGTDDKDKQRTREEIHNDIWAKTKPLLP